MYRTKLLERKNMNMKNLYAPTIHIHRFKVSLHSDPFTGSYLLNWFSTVILAYM